MPESIAKKARGDKSSAKPKRRVPAPAAVSPGAASGLLSQIQPKLVVGRANDPYEREADQVASYVTGGRTGSAPAITPIGAGGLGQGGGAPQALPVQREDEDEAQDSLQAMPLQRAPADTGSDKDAEETPVQKMCATCAAEHKAAEEENRPVKPENLCPNCRSGDDHEGRIQRMANEPEEESPAQAMLLQRVGEEETEGKTPAEIMPVQRAADESGEDDDSMQPVQAKSAFPDIPDVEAESVDKPSDTETNADEEATEAPAEAEKGEESAKNAEAGTAEPGFEDYIPESDPPVVQKQPLDRTTERSPSASTKSAVTLSHSLQQSKGGGNPLPPAVQTDMQHHFGRDLSNVRIHTDDNAAQMSRAIGARAFTHGNNIYFSSGAFAPTSESGKSLLAHELTHTVQQGASGEKIQRYIEPTQEVVLEPTPPEPDDGAQVEGRMRQKIADNPDVKDPADLDEDEREKAQNPNRGELRKESSQISQSGESKPSIDRGAESEQKTGEQKEQVESQINEQPEEAEEEKAEAKEKTAELSEADAAAVRAQIARQQAQAVQVPPLPPPFRHPRIEAPVDSEGEPLPRNSQVDTQVRGLGYIGEMLREKGYEMKRHAAEQKIGACQQDVALEKLRADLANAKEGTATIEAHTESRKEIVATARKGLAESVERQQLVAEKAPDLAGKAEDKRADSSNLANESRGMAERGQSEIPDDDDARGDAEKQSGEMQETAQGTASMSNAVQQAGERARQYEQDAAFAAEQNQQSEAKITETDEIIAQTDERIAGMKATNEESQAKIDNVAYGPDLIRQFSEQSAQSGDELIAATIVMEQELKTLQEKYLAEMAKIESREKAEERLQKEQQEKQPKFSPEEQQLFELAALSEAEQERQIAEMSQEQRDKLMAALDKMMQDTPAEASQEDGILQKAKDRGTDASEGARYTVNLSGALFGDGPADPRAEQIMEVENRRIERVGGVLNIADQNMNYLTVAQQQMLANKLMAQSICDDIANINVLQMGKEMIKGMINPVTALQGVVGGVEKLFGGFANIGNWEAWKKDPLGNLLQIASDITTGLATIFSSILGIASIVTAIMVALIIITWGFAAVTASPVIAWMGTIITFFGKAAMITGALAVLFNYLSYIKNLHDAGTAETSREFFGNVEQIKQNVADGFQGAMAVTEGFGAAKMGPKLTSGSYWDNFPRTPGQWAAQTVQNAKQGLRSITGLPAKAVKGAHKLFSGGKKGLIRFKNKIRDLFSKPKRRPGELDLETPHAKKQQQVHLDDARNKRVRDMEDTEVRAEQRELAKNQPKRVEPGSEHFEEYDVEIEANGHTYRRRRDGKGWCRFSAEECGIPDDALPPQARNDVNSLAPKTHPHGMDAHQKSIIDEIEADLEMHGLEWEDLGIRKPETIDSFLSKYEDPYDGIVELNNRLDRKIDVEGSRASLVEGRGISKTKPEPGLRRDRPDWTRRTERLEESNVFGRANEIETRRMLSDSFDDVADQVRIRPILDNGQPAEFYFIADHLGTSRSGGQIIAFESKLSSRAPLTPNQSSGYPLLSRNGGIIESRNAGQYPYGRQLPATQSYRVQPRVNPKKRGFRGDGPKDYKFKSLDD